MTEVLARKPAVEGVEIRLTWISASRYTVSAYDLDACQHYAVRIYSDYDRALAWFNKQREPAS